MKVALISPVPGYQNELFDILNLFFGSVIRVEAGDDSEHLQVEITENVRDGQREGRVVLTGAAQGDHASVFPISADPLEEKRLHKRQQKLGLYHALTKATGTRPPWGALTGVRPTRLVYDAMSKGASLPEAVAQVQDTFYLSDEKASLLAQIVAVQQGLPRAAGNEVACYIGIPFCPTRCSYCSFLSCEAGDGSLLPVYTQALVREIVGTIRLMADRGLTARSLYVGGGTPTVLPPDLLKEVLQAAQPLIQQAAEVTVEAGRPDSITMEKLRIIRDAGAARISVNPQTMHDATLDAIGRRHSTEQSLNAFQMAREAGFTHINMDLIAGLPGEDLAMFQSSLNQVLALQPEAITVHTLSLKRASTLYREGANAAADAQTGEMVETARQALSCQAYEPYYLYRQKHMAGNLENVGYAKPGYACLYNIDMMEDHTTILAMGAGAVSKWVSPGRERVLRSPNVKDIRHYLNRVEEMIANKNALFEGIGKGVRPPEAD